MITQFSQAAQKARPSLYLPFYTRTCQGHNCKDLRELNASKMEAFLKIVHSIPSKKKKNRWRERERESNVERKMKSASLVINKSAKFNSEWKFLLPHKLLQPRAIVYTGEMLSELPASQAYSTFLSCWHNLELRGDHNPTVFPIFVSHDTNLPWE